jgi:hypothetical protein
MGVDISRFQRLKFRLSRCKPPGEKDFPCLETHVPLNRAEPTNFSIRIALGNGTLSGPVALTTYTDLAGPVGTDKLHLHPILQTVRIPLEDFQQPLTSIRGVRFTFGENRGGAIYVSAIRISGTPR